MPAASLHHLGARQVLIILRKSDTGDRFWANQKSLGRMNQQSEWLEEDNRWKTGRHITDICWGWVCIIMEMEKYCDRSSGSYVTPPLLPVEYHQEYSSDQTQMLSDQEDNGHKDEELRVHEAATISPRA